MAQARLVSALSGPLGTSLWVRGTRWGVGVWIYELASVINVCDDFDDLSISRDTLSPQSTAAVHDLTLSLCIGYKCYFTVTWEELKAQRA